MNVPDIYNIYNINRYYCYNILKQKISDVINNIVILTNDLNKLKTLELIELSNTDIKYEICNKFINMHNINIIQLQKSYKLINTLEINTNNYEYYFKAINEINFENSFIFNKIIENYNNIRYKIIYDLLNHKAIGIIKNKNAPSTLFQFSFFCKKLELILNNAQTIPLGNEEQISLFLNTDFLTFPVIFNVYEARNYILNNPKLHKNVYVKEMIEYVRLKGYVVNMHVQNNQYVMGLVH